MAGGTPSMGALVWPAPRPPGGLLRGPRFRPGLPRYSGGNMKFRFPFALSLLQPFDKLKASSSDFTVPDQ